MAILPCPYNHSQQLKEMADGISIYPRDPIQEEEIYYKKGKKRDRGGGGGDPPTYKKHQKELPEPCQ